ncbi:MAG: phosphatidylglycerophosphatase A [Phycisphaerae bacterium]
MIRRTAITFFGLGYMPFAPGTWGSLGAIVAAGLLLAGMRCAGLSRWYDAALAGLMLLACVLSIVWGRWAIDYFASRARKPGDPGPFVLDEVAGQWLSVIALPVGGLPLATWAGVYAMQFVLFRVFDVIKPPPGRQLERLPAGWGILMDDLGVAVYANIIGQIVVRGWLNA